MKKLLFILSGSLFSFITLMSNRYDSKKTSPNHANDNETTICYKMTVSIGDQKLTIGDTLFIYNDYALEAIHDIIITEDTITINASGKVIKNPNKSSSHVNLSAWYLTNIRDKVGMGFNLSKTPHITRTYTTNTKQLGYGFVDEPFLKDSTQLLQNLVKEKDTIINGQQCTIFMCVKDIPTTANNKPDVIKKTKIIINTEQKDYCYSFISKTLCQRFGGPLIQVEVSYASGLKALMEYNYRKGFTQKEKVLMDKYVKLYNANLHLLDTLKSKG